MPVFDNASLSLAGEKPRFFPIAIGNQQWIW